MYAPASYRESTCRDRGIAVFLSPFRHAEILAKGRLRPLHTLSNSLIISTFDVSYSDVPTPLLTWTIKMQNYYLNYPVVIIKWRPEYCRRCGDSPRAERSGLKLRWGRVIFSFRYSGAHPASPTICTGDVYPGGGVNRPEHGVDHPFLLAPRFREWVELCQYSPTCACVRACVRAWHVTGRSWPITLSFSINNPLSHK
jgi:hypothetical protein